MKIESSILRDLNILLFQVELMPEDQDPRFTIISTLPDWAALYFEDSVAGQTPLLDIFPFLQSFLPEALQYWRMETADRTTSGVWTDVDSASHQHQFEAQALHSDSLPLLALINLSESFNERQHIYQKAREIALANEKLKLQLNQRQRLLHSEIEKQIIDRQPFEQISEDVNANASAVMICKPDGGVEVINQALMDIYQIKGSRSLEGRSLLRKWLREAKTVYPEIHRAVEAGAFWEGEFESEDEDSKKRWIRLAIGPVLESDGSIAHYVCIANDISELRKSSKEVEKLTDYDLTTHLPNRRYFWKKLTKLLDDCVSKQHSIALIYIDLDHFKRINDGLGHHAGDFLLSTVASRLSRSVKRGDFIAHLGGDEFALIIKLSAANIDLGKLALRLMAVLNKPIFIETNSITINASIGIATHPLDGRDATTLMKHADLAMYHAKKMGRNQYQIFTSTLDQHFVGRIRLEGMLREAISKKQFKLLYQPQICTGNDTYLRLEALLRWHHPEEGLIPPSRFIPIAEENGAIISIGKWVMETACKQARQFLDENFDVTMSVNVSARQIKDMSFCNYVDDVLQKTALPPHHLELEITETTVMQDMDQVSSILRRLRESGVAISLDDFGSGFSSLNYLKNLPVDNLKLDRSFIHELPYSDEGKAITSSIISLAHDLKMKVIAEGVETRQQLDLLTEQGCDYIQGYFFYYPLEAEKIKEMFHAIRRAPVA